MYLSKNITGNDAVEDTWDRYFFLKVLCQLSVQWSFNLAAEIRT